MRMYVCITLYEKSRCRFQTFIVKKFYSRMKVREKFREKWNEKKIESKRSRKTSENVGICDEGDDDDDDDDESTLIIHAFPANTLIVTSGGIIFLTRENSIRGKTIP